MYVKRTYTLQNPNKSHNCRSNSTRIKHFTPKLFVYDFPYIYLTFVFCMNCLYIYFCSNIKFSVTKPINSYNQSLIIHLLLIQIVTVLF